eukprot:g17426.t1
MGRLAVLLHPDSFDVTSSASSASTACGASASMCSSYHEAWMARRVSAQVAMVMDFLQCDSVDLHRHAVSFMDEDFPEPGAGGGGADVQMPFSIKWSAEWKTMRDIHALQKVSGPLTKLFWLFAGIGAGVGLSYAPAMLVQKLRGAKKEEAGAEAEGTPAAAAGEATDAAAKAKAAAKAAAYSKNPGVLVTVWDASGITTFHIPEGQIPADLKAEKPQPNTWPSAWRMAFMPFDPETCVNIAHPQEIVINIALCGDWAGNSWWTCKECRNTGFIPNYCIPGHVTEPATERGVPSNASGQVDAYFDIDYVKVRGSKHPRGEEDAGFIRGWEEGMCQLR